MSAQLKGVLFDFDDTLVDWSGVRLGWGEIDRRCLQGVIDWLRPRGLADAIELDALCDTFSWRHGMAWRRTAQDRRAPNVPRMLLSTLRDLGLELDGLDCDALVRAFAWTIVPGTVVFPDVPPLLETLRAKGVRLGIVTNASQPMFMRDRELEAYGLLEYFPDCRLAAADVGWLKPDKRIFNCALARIGASAQETVFIGDNPEADIAGALSVGMKAVLRVADRRPGQGTFADYEPRLRSLEGLPAILDLWYPGWRDGRP